MSVNRKLFKTDFDESLTFFNFLIESQTGKTQTVLQVSMWGRDVIFG